jgi:hypothetical protein
MKDFLLDFTKFIISANAELASTLGISTAAAKKAIDIIDAASTIASIFYQAAAYFLPYFLIIVFAVATIA